MVWEGTWEESEMPENAMFQLAGRWSIAGTERIINTCVGRRKSWWTVAQSHTRQLALLSRQLDIWVAMIELHIGYKDYIESSDDTIMHE